MDKFNDLHDLDNQADKHNRLYSHIFNIPKRDIAISS